MSVASLSEALHVFLFGLCLGFGWHIAGWVVSKVLR